MAPRRGGGGALRSASATVYPPPPSPAGGVDQSLAGARSIRGDDLSDEEMLAPIRFVGRWGLALIAFLTLLVLGALERFSQFLAGSSQHPCELRVRAVLDPFWTVALAYAVFAIGAAVFLFLWETYARSKKVPCWTRGSPQTVDDAQHPRNERYDDLPDDHLAVPRNSIEIDHILENKNFTRDGEPIPELLVLDRCATSPCLGGPAGCWCPPFYPVKGLCWVISVWLVAALLRVCLELGVRAELDCPPSP